MLGNTKILALFLGLSLAAPAVILAQSAPAPAKVGIVAIQAALANTNEGKKEFDALQQRFSPKQAELKNQNDEIENLKKQLQAQGDKLTEEARATQVRAIEAKQKVLQRNLEDAQNEYQQAQQEVVGRLGEKMLKVLEQYAQKNGYAVIMDVSNPQTPVLYAAESTNITKELVDAYNAANSAAAPAPKPAAAAPAPKPAAGSSATAPAPKKP